MLLDHHAAQTVTKISLTCHGEVQYLEAVLMCSASATNCITPLKTTPFCAGDSWALWASNDTYPWFCCLEGQIRLQTGKCVSGKQVIASSLTATLVRLPLFVPFCMINSNNAFSTDWCGYHLWSGIPNRFSDQNPSQQLAQERALVPSRKLQQPRRVEGQLRVVSILPSPRSYIMVLDITVLGLWLWKDC
jgi:hypothetical protein